MGVNKIQFSDLLSMIKGQLNWKKAIIRKIL